MVRFRLWCSLLLVLATLCGRAARAEPVDLELVLAVDCSGSIDMDEFALQIRGYAQALTHPSVLRAIQSGGVGAIAVTYVQWSGPFIQNQVVGWTVIKDEKTATAFAAALTAAPRRIFGGGTSLSGAIDYAQTLFGNSGFEAPRHTIDVSGDGTNNSGRRPGDARDEAVHAGITINGLPILTDFPMLDRYYEENVIGGPGAFVIPAKDFASFAQAILGKLIREVAEGTAAPRPSPQNEIAQLP
jgi:hypothetical protein